MVGSVALSFEKKYLPFVIILAGIAGTIQLALSAWSVVAKWDDKYAYALRAMQAQTRLFNEWDRLAKIQPSDAEKIVKELESEDQRQEQADLTQHITGREKRYAMRASLYQFGNACQKCNAKPASMSPTKCDACGNF